MDPVSIATAAAAAAKALFVTAELCRTFRNATRDIDHSVEALESLSRGLAVVEDGDAGETAESDDDSDDELGSHVTASLFKRGMKCYAREEFGEAREWLQRGIAQAGPLSPEEQDELKVPSMQFHHALCCIVESILGEAESSFLLVIKGSGSREEDARLRCFAHYHLARVQLKMGKLDSAHHDYHKSLRLLALIVWANGSKYDAQAYSDQLPQSQQIPEDQFDEELSLVLGSHRSEITLREDATENAGGHSIMPTALPSFASPRPISLDGTEKGTTTATFDRVSTVGTEVSVSRTNRSTLIIDSSSAAIQIIVRKGFHKKNGVKKGIRWATKEGRLDVLNTLLQDPSADVDMHKSSMFSADRTPLRTAASRGLYAICERLLEANAAVNLMIEGQTALDGAIESGHKDVCRLLLEHGANVDGPEPDVSTPLVEAARANAINACRLLLECNVERHLQTAKGTAVEAASGWLKQFIREWPASRS